MHLLLTKSDRSFSGTTALDAVGAVATQAQMGLRSAARHPGTIPLTRNFTGGVHRVECLVPLVPELLLPLCTTANSGA